MNPKVAKWIYKSRLRKDNSTMKELRQKLINHLMKVSETSTLDFKWKCMN